MNEYIFYTDEGYCESPNGTQTENFQVLGFEKGNSKDEALKKLVDNNIWIKEYGYNVDNIIGIIVQR